jgi:ubiquinone/menaquinone biosynthesis C-methylase UbiE
MGKQFQRQKEVKTIDFTTVTETTGSMVTEEQLRRMYTRYRFASEMCRGKEVLEVGFGSGQGLGYLARSAKKVIGVEYDEKLLETARSYYKDRIELLHMDAQNLLFEDGSFDVVVLYEALYYLPKPETFLLGSYRVLRDNGTIILCSANKDVSGFNPSPYSYRYFSAPELFFLLDNSGYRRIRLYGDCGAAAESMKDSVKMFIKRSAVKLNIMPKTMKGKKLLKRIFFGKLVELPPEIDDQAAEYVPPRQIPPDVPNREFKVIFAVAHKLMS